MHRASSEPLLYPTVQPHLTRGVSSLSYIVAEVCPIAVPRARSRDYGFFHCQICKLLISVNIRRPRLAAVCPRCLEATPIRQPATDKRFYRCRCYCLLLVSRHQNVLVCPRPSCSAILATQLAMTNPKLILAFFSKHFEGDICRSSLPNVAFTFSKDSDWRYVVISCGACHQQFKVSPTQDLSGEVRCPECNHLSTMTPRFPRLMTRQYLVYSLLVLLISSSITFGTYCTREKNGGIFVITAGLFVVSGILFIQGLLYATLPISTIISGAAGVE